MSAREVFSVLRANLQSYVMNELNVTIPSEFLSIDNETAIMFLRMKVKPIYNDKNIVQNHVQALEQLYPDISNKINDEQRKKLFKFLEAMLELV